MIAQKTEWLTENEIVTAKTVPNVTPLLMISTRLIMIHLPVELSKPGYSASGKRCAESPSSSHKSKEAFRVLPAINLLSHDLPIAIPDPHPGCGKFPLKFMKFPPYIFFR
jgi:hypothetical protein